VRVGRRRREAAASRESAENRVIPGWARAYRTIGGQGKMMAGPDTDLRRPARPP